jgi:hypothetical protein
MKPNRPTVMRAEVTNAFDGPSALEGRRRGVHVFFAVVRTGGIEDKAK